MLHIPEYNEASSVFYFFEEISKIPHGSGNTKKIADYLVNFAKSRGLECIRDMYDNVVIRKPATEGYEDRPCVALQGHLDMVAEKTPDTDIDMENEGLTLYRDGDFIRARGTTLGGDDGVAIAYALALLDSSDIPHPELEAVFTSDEEIGLIGAVNIAPEMIRARLLINVDSDVEGIFTVGCAGGMRSDVTLNISRESEILENVITLNFGGFKGGHSGVEIDKGRENALKVVFSALSECEARLVSFSGGNADNAIPRACECKIIADKARLIAALESAKDKNKLNEPDICYTITKNEELVRPLSASSSSMAIALINDLPSGIISMSKDIEGLVETSLNLGILRLSCDTLTASFSVRSAKGAEKIKLGERLKEIANKYGADYSERGHYPAWEYRESSHLRDVMVDVYRKMYEKAPEVVIIHAGLECGILSEKLPLLDSVSIGPDNFDIHTTEEHLSISSTARVWEFLKTVLKEI